MGCHLEAIVQGASRQKKPILISCQVLGWMVGMLEDRCPIRSKVMSPFGSAFALPALDLVPDLVSNSRY